MAREVFLRKSCHMVNLVDYFLMEQHATVLENMLEVNMLAIYLSCSEREMLSRAAERGRWSEHNIRLV